METLRKAKGKRKRFFQGPPCKGRQGGKGEQTLQLGRDGTPPADQGNSGVNSKEIEMTIKYRAEGSSKHACVHFGNKCKSYNAKTACCVGCHRSTTTSSLPVAGTLGHSVENCRAFTANQWVLNTVQGFLIPFQEEPKQDQVPHPYQYLADQLIQLWEELALLVSKGAITCLKPTMPVTGFYSTMFLALKKESLGSKEGESAETGYKPQSPQLLGSTPTFQDEGNSHVKRGANPE